MVLLGAVHKGLGIYDVYDILLATTYTLHGLRARFSVIIVCGFSFSFSVNFGLFAIPWDFSIIAVAFYYTVVSLLLCWEVGGRRTRRKLRIGLSIIHYYAVYSRSTCDHQPDQ